MNQLACILLLASSALAQQVWVDATRGNDSNPGTAALPVKSIAKGVSLASTNSTVTILPGLYGAATTAEVFPIGVGTTLPHQGIVIRGVGTVIVDMGGSATTGFEIGVSATGGRITNLRLRNSDQVGWWTRTIHTTGSPAGFEIDRCVFDGVNRGIVVWEAAPDIRDFKIHHNLFLNLGNDAINVFEKEGRNDVFHNTIVGRTSGPNYVGILIESPAAVVSNNLITGMRDGFLCGLAAVPGSFLNNCGWQNVRDFAGSITTPPPGHMNMDPSFVAASSGDYRLRPTTGLLDRGDPGVVWRADLDRFPSPIDGDRNGTLLPDVGAYEVPIDTMTVTHTPSTGALVVRLDGPVGQVGAILFAGEDGLLPLPGIGPVLLDMSRYYAVTSPPLTLPFTLSGVVPMQAPGAALVLQAAALDPARTQIALSNSHRIQW
jgi:hypothetical protein